MSDTRPMLGPYEVLEAVGKGGMATVHRGRRRETGQIVAIKIMEAQYASNPVLVKRFEQEYAAASRLRHPNIVPVWDYGQVNGRPYLVMEFIDGENLGRRIKRQGALAEEEAVRIILQVADGLHAAHRLQMIHRDVKTENILLSKDGQAKLSDLGLIKYLDGEPLTKTRTCLGTIAFVAPEQFEDAKRADLRADIYGLGATLYHALTGVMPFEGKRNLQILRKKIQNDFIPPRQLVKSISARVEQAICKALDGAAEKRHASCREFMESLLPASGPPPAAESVGARAADPRVERRRAFRYPTALAAKCRPVQGGSNTWAAIIEDVSGTGVRLQLDRRFEPGAVLALLLPNGAAEAATYLTKVVWVRAAGSRKWCMGCMFKRELAPAELETLLGDKPVTILVQPD